MPNISRSKSSSHSQSKHSHHRKQRDKSPSNERRHSNKKKKRLSHHQKNHTPVWKTSNSLNSKHKATKTKITKQQKHGHPLTFHHDELNENKYDTSFGPYYRLISDISQCDTQTLLKAIQSIYGLESLQVVLRTFLIKKLKKSLGLDAGKGLIYSAPMELMCDNDNNIFETMGKYIPSFLTKKNKKNKKKDNLNINRKIAESMTLPTGLSEDEVDEKLFDAVDALNMLNGMTHPIL